MRHEEPLLRRMARGVVLAVLVTAVAWLSGCGYKTRPVPPQEVVPRPITDLRYTLTEKGVTLTWTYPKETVKGTPITGIDAFLLYRAVVPKDDYCAGCPLPFGEPMVIDGGEVPKDGVRQGVWSSSLLRPGHRYFFKIRSRLGWWTESADSNVVSFLWEIPVKAPAGLQAEAGDGEVGLRWRPVTEKIDSSPVEGEVRYQVYRAAAGGPFQALGRPVTETAFTDTTAKNGVTYYYQVQAVEVAGTDTVAGGMSEPVSARPRDLTPPPPPGGVRALRTAKGVKVFWDPVEDADLKGYRVYRRVDGGKPQLVGEVLHPYTLFTDEAVPDAKRWYYSVTSFDHQDPANESVASPEALVRR